MLRQPFANLRSLNADHSIVGGIVVDGTTKHLHAKHSLAQVIDPASERMFDDQLEEGLSAFAAFKCLSVQNLLQMGAQQDNAFVGKIFSLPFFFVHRENP